MAVQNTLEFQPAIELTFPWTDEDIPLRNQVGEHFGEELNEFINDVELKNFIHGYKKEGIEIIIERIQGFIDFKSEHGYATMLDEEFIESVMIGPACPTMIYKQDDQGHPVLYCRTEEINFEICKSMKQELGTYFRRVMCHLDHIKQEVSDKQLHGNQIWRHVTIVDVHNLGLLDVKSIYNTLSALFQMGNCCYPENVHYIIAINSNWKFRMIKKLFDWMVDPSTAKKIKVLGSSWIKEVSKFVPITNIPRELGGESEEPWVAGGIVLPSEVYDKTQI